MKKENTVARISKPGMPVTPYPLWAKIICCMLVPCCIALIFSFSLASGGESSGLSRAIASFLAGRQLPEGTLLEAVIRKLGHLSEYALLGLLMSFCLRAFKPKPGKHVMWLFAAALVVACVDETIQSFTPGRMPLVTDVLIDITGAALGIAVFFGVRALNAKRRAKHG